MIDDPQQLAAALAASEERLARTLEETETGSWEWDLRSNEVWWSANLGPLHGLGRGEQPKDYEEYLALIHPDDRARVEEAIETALQNGSGYEIELRPALASGEPHWIWAQASVITDEAGRPLRIVGITRDVTDRIRREEREALLRAASEALSSSLDLERTLGDVVRIVVPRIADWCSIDVVEESSGGIVNVALASSGAEQGRFGFALERISPSSFDAAVGSVLRAGKALLYPDVADKHVGDVEDDPERALVQELGLGSAMIVPLGLGGATFGAITFVTREAAHRFDVSDLAFAEELARRAALAIDNVRAHQAEQKAREAAEAAAAQMERLQRLAALLSASATPVEIARILVREGAESVGAVAGWVSVLSTKDDELEHVASFGYEESFVEENRRIPLDAPHVGAQVVRTGATCWLERTSDDSRPELRSAHRATGAEALAMVPLVAAGRPFGFMALRFAGTRVFAHAERELLLTFARQCGQALERARLYERERKAREWLGRLQAVTAAVSGASDVDAVGEAVIDQALVSLGAAAGVVALVDRKGMLRQLAAGGADELGLVARFPIEEVTQTRGLVVWPETPGCLASVPLLAGGRPIGALVLSFKDRDELTASERDFLVALARLAAQALERSLLHQEEQLSRQAAERARDRVRKLEAVAQAGLAAKTLDDLLVRLLPLLAGLFEADRAALLLVDEEQGELRMRAAVGLDEAVQAQVRVPVGLGIAGKIAASGNSLLVNDVSTADPQSAYLREHGGSLLGVPLKAEGRVIGVLHVSSDRLSAFEDRDLRLLTVAGDRVALALERISLYEREHETAITLQRSVLPQGLPEVDRVQLAARYVPGSAGVEVGGDWYDALELGRGRLGLVVGDVVGKGVLAAAMTAQLRTALRVYALDGLDPAPVLAQLNRMAETTGPSFATLIYAVIDTESLICQFASAGHPPPLLVRADGPAEFLEGGRSVPLGIRTDIGYSQDAVRLDAGDTIVLYTDGLVERRGSTLEEGLEQLKSSAQHGPAEVTTLLDHLLEVLLAGDSAKDDIALLAVRATPEPS